MDYHIVLLSLIMLHAVKVLAVTRECRPLDACSCQWTDTNAVVSLWGIDNPNEIQFKDIPILHENNSYIDYSPCSTFTEGGCHGDLVCEHDKERTESSFLSLAKPSKMSVHTKENSTLVFYYEGGTEGGLPRTTAITLACATGKPVLSSPKEADPGYFSFTLTTHCACDNFCIQVQPDDNTRGGLSTGSLLCVLFLTVVLVYFIGGYLYLRCYKKQDGTDAIPQFEFWQDLPAKIKDGFRFTQMKVTGSSSKPVGEYDNF